MKNVWGARGVQQTRQVDASNAIQAALEIGRVLSREIAGPLNKIQNILKIESGPPPLLGFSKFVDKVCGWIPLNPNDLERSRAIVSTYHLEDPENILEDSESTRQAGGDQVYREAELHRIQLLYGMPIKSIDATFPHVGAMLNLFSQICSSSNSVIAISGRRGAGKTLALNFFLATAHKKLSENGILWLRTDVAKLWAMQSSDEDVSTNVSTYTILHGFFIFLRYADVDPCLTPFLKRGIEFKVYLDSLVADKAIDEEVGILWDVINREYENSDRRGSSKPVTEFLKHAGRESRRFNLGALEILYTEAIAFLRKEVKKKGQKLRVLIIFDGVDNIRVGASRQRYDSFLKEIANVTSKQQIYLGDKYLVVARPETFSDLSRIRPEMPVGAVLPVRFEVKTDSVNGVLNIKQNLLVNPITYWRQIAREETGTEVVDTASTKGFETNMQYLLKALHVWGEDLGTKKDEPGILDKGLSSLDLLFDGNYRSLLRNVVRAHNYVERNRISSSDVPRLRGLLEGSVLAGCESIAENLNDDVHGHWCPNLFENAAILGHHWTGLSMIRLIQLLWGYSDGCTRAQAIEFLEREFGYSRAKLELDFQTAWEFSLIRPYKDEVYGINEKTARARTEPIFKSTAKGNHIVRLALSDYAVFYFMAVGTPLDLSLLDSIALPRKDLVHGKGRLRHFIRSAFVTGSLLWRHIQISHDREWRQLRRGLNIAGAPVDRNWFLLSEMHLWEKSVVERAKWISPSELRLVINSMEMIISEQTAFEA